MSLPANAIATAFAVRLLGGTGYAPIRALICVHIAAASGVLSASTLVARLRDAAERWRKAARLSK